MTGPASIVLASSSPRRQDLLRRLKIPFSICPAKSDGPIVSDDPAQRVAGHASFKAQEIASKKPNTWVLAGDTLVFGGHDFFAKPVDLPAARQMLLRLQELGEHRVYTALCLLSPSGKAFQQVDYSVVAFDSIPNDELEKYLEGSEWCDKAGAYAIQGWAKGYAHCVYGDIETVIGMSELAVKKLFVLSGFQYSAE